VVFTRRIRVKRILIAIACILVAPAAVQAGTVWTSPPAGCTPSDGSMQFNRYTVVGGTIKHQSSNVDLITIYCRIPGGGTTAGSAAVVDRISMTYRDSDGSLGSGIYVTAHLIHMDPLGYITVIGTVASNSFVETGIVRKTVTFPAYAMDFATGEYYVRVDLDRVTINDVAIVYALALQNGP
jgi:hypothetical protein